VTGKPARVLIIAGSDSSGGAGIQADIKTATALGAYAMTAVTAVTAQDTTGVHTIFPIPPRIVREQILACLNDIGADAIKTGMLGSAELVEVVAETLAEYAKDIPLVVDPVMASTSGSQFLDDDALKALKCSLVPLATLITPNEPEFQRLSASFEEVGEVVGQGKSIAPFLAFGVRAILVKGGHSEGGGEIVDFLYHADGESKFASTRLDTTNTHGTGCTLSTAIACGLGEGMALKDAVARAHAFVHEAIRTAPGFGRGRGPLNHMHALRRDD
jgi:hydroxymethylpyrimidine/phosphomethylpyrimidine kinase